MRRLTGLPDTTTRRPGAGRTGSERRRAGPATVAAGLVILLLALALLGAHFLSGGGSERLAPGVSSFVLSGEDSEYPPADDTRSFESPPAVHAYLTLDGARPGSGAGSGFEVRVERRSLPLGNRGPELRVESGSEDRLVSGPEGLSGLLRFAVRAEGGEELPPGRYTLLVVWGEEEVVRQRFTVG